MRRFFFLPVMLLTGSVFADNLRMCPASLDAPKATQLSDACAHASPSELATILGWTPTAVTEQNLCGGYYFEPASITAHPDPLPLMDMPMDISSTGTALYNLTSDSTLQGNVTLTQPGREISADKAILTPNKDTGEIEKINLQGHVKFQEAGRLIVGQTSQIDMAKDTLVVNQGAYHIIRPSDLGPMDSWGTADEAHRFSPTLSVFKQATYTTCTPTDPSWYLKSKQVTLNKETGRGVAKHVVIYAKNVPFFYTPYLSFPIDKRRYSGFLYPDFGYDSQSGAFIGIPYYFNLAPNYDDTVTVSPMSKRGVMVSNEFRYLTLKNNGSLALSFLPDDSAFSNFKRDTKLQYPSSGYNDPFLEALDRSSNNRGSLNFHNDTAFNTRWAGALDANYVTDDYYFQDFGGNLASVSTDQLLNQASVVYEGERWQFSGRVQAWQTLHPINQSFVLDQYRRLPELTLSSAWPNVWHGLSYAFNSEWVYFDHTDDFFSHLPYPTGNRLHVNPQLSLPLVSRAAFFTPTLALDVTNYFVQNNSVDVNGTPMTVIPGTDPGLNKMRVMPVFSIDSGLYFDRNLHLGSKDYSQTLEPRAFYSFVPAVDQDDIPIFDTTLPPFSIDELYRTNRFMGYDRVGDANQVSFGLTSRLLDGYTGEEKIKASVGAIYYLRKHTICLYADCHDDPTIEDRVSPIAGQLSYHLNPAISLTGDAAWDPNKGQMNNAGVSFRYNPISRGIVNVSYHYIKNGDLLDSSSVDSVQNNLHRIDLGISWPLTAHWNAIADWDYNISHDHPQTYFYGAEYETCCWAIRLMSSRVLQTEDAVGNTTFRSAYYVQFMLKGLGSAGDSQGSALLAAAIPGYPDRFGH